jgi:small subunit ribosomal protein S1
MREAAAAGAEVAVLIVSIDAVKRRIALALAPEGAALGQQTESTVEVGAVLTGTVERLEPFGVFVRLGPGQTGLVPTAELAMGRGTDPRKAFPVGSEIKVLVLAIEEGGRRIRLSHTQALAREEQAETQAYLQQGSKRGDGFGLTLGERMKQGPRKRL